MPEQNFEQLIQITSHELNHLYGEDYFIKLVNKLADIVQADYAFVGRFEKDLTEAQTIALWGKGQLQDNFSYSLKHTPCAEVASDTACYYPENITKLFPKDHLLVEMNISAYLGVPLKNSVGEVIGLLVALFEQPLREKESKQLIFEIFSTRASAELDRYTYEQLLAEKIQQLEASNQRLQIASQIFRFANDGLLITDFYNRIVDMNPALEHMTGYRKEELIGQHQKVLNEGLISPQRYREVRDILREKGSWHGEYRRRHRDGGSYPAYNSISVLPGNKPEENLYITISRDISDEKQAQEQIAYQASYDQLTDLHNRYAFERHLSHFISTLPTGSKGAFLLLDIDNFKTINDSAGHMAGDALLQQVAWRMKAAYPEDILARMGGDEFALFCKLEENRSLDECVEQLVQLFNEPFTLKNGEQIAATTSVGVSLFPEDADSSLSLFKSADQALYKAKDAGRNSVAFFNSELKTTVHRHQQVLQRLVRALDKEQITPHFQPIIEIASGRVSHVEALARWNDEELGNVSPVEFIEIAESNGLMRRLGPAIFRKACKQISQLNNGLSYPIGVSINQSPQEFIASETPDTSLIDEAAGMGLSPELICVELTESLTIKNPELAKRHLSALKAKGIGLSMDDFGTGYSSLIYLKHFPFSYIKIDRAFIKDIADDHEDYLIAKTIIEMAHNFGMKTIAEGVETDAHLRVLESIGCDYAQGYLFTPALPVAELEKYLRKHTI